MAGDEDARRSARREFRNVVYAVLSKPPGYWMDEVTGVLRPAVEAYLNGAPMTLIQLGAMRAYLRQWIAHPGWMGEEVEELRRDVEKIRTRKDIEAWLDAAGEINIDPL